MNDIKDALPSSTFTSAEKRCRAKLEETLYQLSEEEPTILENVALTKKRKTEIMIREEVERVARMTATEEDMFLQTVSEECRKTLSLKVQRRH